MMADTLLFEQYIAKTILKINEKRSFKQPENLTAEQRVAQDEEIFQRSRLVNCAFFMQIILGDYVGAILGLSRDGYSWRLPVREVDILHEGHLVGADATFRNHCAGWIIALARAEKETWSPSSSI